MEMMLQNKKTWKKYDYDVTMILFELKKGPLWAKKGIFKPQKGLKLGILAQNTSRKAHMGLKWLILVHKSY